MATKQELTDGLAFLVRETTRISDGLTADQWSHVVDLDGWKGSEVLAHVAGVASLVAPMAGGFASAPAGTNAMAGFNIDDINAGLVSARAGRSVRELADEVSTAYAGVIEFVRNAPDSLLSTRVTVGGYKDVEMSDILVRMVIMHGLAHLYSVYAAVMNNP